MSSIRFLHVPFSSPRSGTIPVATDGTVPPDFEGQCRLVWANIGAQLRAAGLDYGHLVKVTTYLSDRRFGDANGAIRREILGAHAPALTVLIAGICDEKWLLEIEAMAAA
jgi:enamine deaminase RidA (YjgF/YER057c/UK114 family)